MKHDADKHDRRSIRLPGYDYAQVGGYFVRIVTKDRICLFGEIVDGELRMNGDGRIVQAAWDELPEHYPGVECDVFMVMPNHVHGIIVLADDGGGVNDVGAGFKPARGVAVGPTSVRWGLKPAPTRIALSEIIRGFKTFSARRVNELRETLGVPIWQRNYYEHVVRGENELNRIREYIANNPPQWNIDRENPNPTELKSIGKRESWEGGLQ
jgi:REP element-mobilizing transposase RayT